jgi:hypothetical protein
MGGGGSRSKNTLHRAVSLEPVSFVGARVNILTYYDILWRGHFVRLAMMSCYSLNQNIFFLHYHSGIFWCCNVVVFRFVYCLFYSVLPYWNCLLITLFNSPVPLLSSKFSFHVLGPSRASNLWEAPRDGWGQLSLWPACDLAVRWICHRKFQGK